MFEVTWKTVVEIPQLDVFNQNFLLYGERLMANFDVVTAEIAALRNDIITEAQQVTAKLDELAALIQQDMTDQANVDAAAAAITEMRAMVQGMVPDVAPSAPASAPSP